MTDDNNLAFTILHALEIAVLSRKGPGEYEFYGEVPFFYGRLFPSSANGACVRPWEYSPMLEHFLEDAELFFTRNLPGSINTGVWQEDGICDGDQALYAQAMIVDGQSFIIIRLMKEGFSERVTVLRKAREQLLEHRSLNTDLELYKNKSRFDGLTKVLNKETFIERLVSEIAIAADTMAPLSLAIVDVDYFKAINDTYGHLAGDSVLMALGRLLRAGVRREDIVARFGGEEFIIVTPFSTLDQMYRTAEKLRKTIEEYDFSPADRITVSIGCTAHAAGENWESFLQRADLALYEAKHSGRNAVKIR